MAKAIAAASTAATGKASNGAMAIPLTARAAAMKISATNDATSQKLGRREECQPRTGSPLKADPSRTDPLG